MLALPRIIFTFNKFFYDLVKDLKLAAPELKNTIKKHYAVKNKDTSANFDLFAGSLTDDVVKCLGSSTIDGVFAYPEVGNIIVLVDTNVSDILLQISSGYKETFLSYLYIFSILVEVSKLECPDDSLFMAVMHAINAIQKHEDYASLVEDIIDDDVSNMLNKLALVSAFSKPTTGSRSGADVPSSIENTQIGSIAREIAESIDLDSLNIKKPEDLLNAENGSMIGDLVSKVSSKLQQKFENGSVNQEDLIKEAMSMMSMFGGAGAGGGGSGGMGGMGDMFTNLMKAATASSASSNPTKDRLKKKLELRKP